MRKRILLIALLSMLSMTSFAQKESQANSELALRTNLLNWAALTPDVGIEWHVSHDWDLLVNGQWTNIGKISKNSRYANWEVSPEIRYRLGMKKCGYLGLMCQVGEFNYKLAEIGKQGFIIGGGITGGYILHLNDYISLDFSIGAGCTHADFEKYSVTENVRVKKGKGTDNYWGINHIGITLVWNLF